MAVINLPGVARALVNAGFNVVGGGLADTKTTIDLVRDMNRENEQLIVIIAIDDPSLRMWATLQAAVDIPVLIVRSEVFPGGDGIPKTRNFELPCSVNDLMAVFGAPPADEMEVEIGIDGQEIGSSAEGEGLDNFDVFAATSTSLRLQSKEDPHTITPTVAESSRPESEVPASSDVFAVQYGPSTSGESSAEVPQDESIFTAAEPSSSAQSVFDVRPEEPVKISQSTEEVLDLAPEPDVAPPVFTTKRTPRERERLGQVIVVFAGKGGATKSTTTGALAERGAVVVPGLKVVVVDLSRGQGAQRSLLRLNDADVPSIFDAAISKSPDVYRDVLIRPKRLNALRGGLKPLSFGVILAPPKDQADRGIVTSRVYADSIDYARRQADLVFIDTQTIEAKDTTGLIDDVVVPLLLDGAWGLGLSDSSTEGVENLEWILRKFVERGISSSRLMVAFNRVNPTTVLNPDAVTARFSPYATWMGAVMFDSLVEATHGSGEIPGSTKGDAMPEYTALLDHVLYRITGLASFTPKPSEVPINTSSKSKRRFRRRR